MTEDRIDARLGLLSDGHRREIIHVLRHEVDGEATIDDLLDRLAGGEPPTVGGRRSDRDRLAIDLVHKHLPKLADHGVVEYDSVAGTVRYRPDGGIEAAMDSLHVAVAWATR